ncbi:hypothetical protein KAR91_50565 [Candidatus Pacearchaeota archaeon]|nr:hypothetical protein [Candidatus Pacearchaeota archaeon]
MCDQVREQGCFGCHSCDEGLMEQAEPLELPADLLYKINALLEAAGYYNSEDEDETGEYTYHYEGRAGFNLPKLRLVVDSNG